MDCPPNLKKSDIGSLSMGRGKRFRNHYPEYQTRFNITEEIEKYIGTAHRLDNWNSVYVQKPTITANQFENINTNGKEKSTLNPRVSIEFRKNKFHSYSGDSQNDLEELKVNYNTESANSVKTGEEKLSIDKKENIRIVSDVITLRAILSNNSKVQSLKAKLANK